MMLHLGCGSVKPSCAGIQIYRDASEGTSRVTGGIGTSPQPGILILVMCKNEFIMTWKTFFSVSDISFISMQGVKGNQSFS